MDACGKHKIYCEKKEYYKYYDTPDGCDVDKKIMVASRYGFVGGLFLGTYDILMVTHAIGFGNMLARYARHVVPLAAMGATFAAVANGMQHARDADDPLNYFVGGLACGPLVALYTRSGHGLVAGGIFLGLIGVIKKESIDRGVDFVQKFPNHMNSIRDWRADYTFVKDPRDAMRHTCDVNFNEEEDDEEDVKKKKKRNKDKEGKKKCP